MTMKTIINRLKRKFSSTKRVTDPFENVYTPPLFRTVNANVIPSEWERNEQKKANFRAQYTIDEIQLIRIKRTE